MKTLRNITAIMQQVQGQNRAALGLSSVLQNQYNGSNDLKHKYGQYTIQLHKMATCASNLVEVAESRRFMIDCFLACKVPQSHAVQMADLLVNADYRKHFSHGMNRLEMYINDILKKNTDPAAIPTIIKELPATAWVDGQNGLGAVVGNFCMDLAIKKAKKCGIGLVCAKKSNHYGIACWYTLTAMKEGLIGISMTNTSPLVVPTRSKEPMLGTNPLAMGVPAKDDKFILDMATSAVAVGKIEINKRKGVPIPKGWAQNSKGKMTTNAEEAFKAGCLMPLGGLEETSGYKGYGLGALIDILCGVLSGANYSTKIRKWSHSGEGGSAADLGQLFIAIDPKSFSPCFAENMSDFNCRLRNSAAIDPTKPVLVPGDIEEEAMRATNAAGGIEYVEQQLKNCDELAKKLKVKPLRFI